MKYFRLMALCALIMVAVSLTVVPLTAQTSAGVLNIYSARHYGAIEAAFDQFTADTGIQVRVSQGSPTSLLERLRAEGAYTPADLFLSIDAGTMMLAVDEGLIQPVGTELVEGKLAEGQYDPNGHWFALSKRVRSIVYNPETVDMGALSTYEQLADPMWKDRLCFRPGAHIYTISLVSSLIYNLGVEEAEKVVAGWVANNPTYIDSDTRILETIEAGGCDVGLTNHYYLARKLNENPDYPVKLFWANQESTGTFYNVNIVGVTTAALNLDNAKTFIEYFSTVEGQDGKPVGFPGSNNEYPTNPEATLGEIIATFGEVKLDIDYGLAQYGEYQQQAIDLINKVGYGLTESK
jgi:iron(III) transport system substrate-binding protein